MVRTIFSMVLSLSVFVAGLSAQPNDRFICYDQNDPPNLYEVSDQGSVLKTIALAFHGFIPHLVTMAEDNQSYRVTGYRYLSPGYTGGILDVSPAGSVKTIAAGGMLARPIVAEINSDGDWLVVSAPSPASTKLDVFRIRGTVISTLSVAMGVTMVFGGAMHEDSGQLVIRGQTPGVPSNAGYFRLDAATGTVTSFALWNHSTFFGMKRPHFEGATGAFIDYDYANVTGLMTIHRIHPDTGAVPVTKVGIPVFPTDLTSAGQRTIGVSYYTLGRAGTFPPFYVAHIKGDGTLSGAHALKGVTPSPYSAFLRIGNRHMCWSLDTPPNGRTLHLSFPGEGGLAYFAALSLGGVRPGVKLADGREIPLILDWIALACITHGGIGSVIQNARGILDSTGRASVKVDTNAFGTVLRGLKAWAAAIVIDPKAPSGIAYIVGPKLLVLK